MLAKAYVEITTFCGLNCDFCEPSKAPSVNMELSLFEKINQELHGKTKTIAYHILGDPLTVGNLSSYLEISARYGHAVELTTTGRYLKHINKKILIHPAVRQINFSLSSFFANKNMGLTLQEYMDEILEFCLFSADNPKRFVNLRLWNIGDDSYLSFNSQIDEILETRLSKPLYKKRKARVAPYTVIVKDKMFSWPNVANNILSQTGSCHAISSQLGFLADGKVVPCCLDAKGCMELGNIKNQNLDEILNSTMATEMARGFKNGVLLEKMCQTCGFREVRL